MTAQHRTPCGECPFRRASAPGWLGAAEPEQFIATAESDLRMPCHTQVDYESRNWEAQARRAPQCAGRAAYLRNRCKMPRDHDLADFVRSVERNPDVFATVKEFLDHHG